MVDLSVVPGQFGLGHGQAQVGEAADQPVEGDLQFHPGKVLARAVVDAEPEGQVPLGLARQVEPIRFGEHGLVAVRRRKAQQHHLAGPDDDVADRDLGQGHPREARGVGAEQVDVAQQFVHRAGDPARVLDQPQPLVAVPFDEGKDRVGQLARDGVEARAEQGEAVGHQLPLAEAVFVVAGGDEPGQHVVAGVDPLAGDEAHDDLVQLGEPLLGLSLGTLLGLFAAGPVVHGGEHPRPLLELPQIPRRHAEKLADDGQRHRHGEIFDEVDG